MTLHDFRIVLLRHLTSLTAEEMLYANTAYQHGEHLNHVLRALNWARQNNRTPYWHMRQEDWP